MRLSGGRSRQGLRVLSQGIRCGSGLRSRWHKLGRVYRICRRWGVGRTRICLRVTQSHSWHSAARLLDTNTANVETTVISGIIWYRIIITMSSLIFTLNYYMENKR